MKSIERPKPEKGTAAQLCSTPRSSGSRINRRPSGTPISKDRTCRSPASISSKESPPNIVARSATIVYEAMVEALKAPKDDRFQIITEHPTDALIADENYLGIRRTQDCIFIQLTLNAGRTVEQKKAFYKAVADALHARLGLRPEDVFINLIEVQKENWSFGNRDRSICGVIERLAAHMISSETLKRTARDAT